MIAASFVSNSIFSTCMRNCSVSERRRSLSRFVVACVSLNSFNSLRAACKASSALDSELSLSASWSCSSFSRFKNSSFSSLSMGIEGVAARSRSIRLSGLGVLGVSAPERSLLGVAGLGAAGAVALDCPFSDGVHCSVGTWSPFRHVATSASSDEM